MGGKTTKKFGGTWTLEKLSVLRNYLNAYTKALKNQPFKLMYIDPFAGSGTLDRPDTNGGQLSFYPSRDSNEGSVQIALNVKDKPFDKLLFNDSDEDRKKELDQLKASYPGRDIEVFCGDANAFAKWVLRRTNWKNWRAVMFLDPFATQVERETLKQIAKTNAVDTLILFPHMAVTRTLPNEEFPRNKKSLNRVFGKREIWENFYQPNDPQFLMGPDESNTPEVGYRRIVSSRQILDIYKEGLKEIFGERLLAHTKRLDNAKHSHLFELIFCAGNYRGIRLAHKLAGQVMGGS